jgi:hypothetical protein
MDLPQSLLKSRLQPKLAALQSDVMLIVSLIQATSELSQSFQQRVSRLPAP